MPKSILVSGGNVSTHGVTVHYKEKPLFTGIATGLLVTFLGLASIFDLNHLHEASSWLAATAIWGLGLFGIVCIFKPFWTPFVLTAVTLGGVPLLGLLLR